MADGQEIFGELVLLQEEFFKSAESIGLPPAALASIRRLVEEARTEKARGLVPGFLRAPALAVNLSEVRRDLGRLRQSAARRELPRVALHGHLTALATWVGGLPGNPTTPPPIFFKD